MNAILQTQPSSEAKKTSRYFRKHPPSFFLCYKLLLLQHTEEFMVWYLLMVLVMEASGVG